MQSEESTGAKPSIGSLTGLRFFAALAIFNVHSFYPENWGYSIHWLLMAIRDAGHAGVCLFFILSGFVLAYSQDKITSSYRDSVKFWINRFARIYPAYVLGMILVAPFFLTHRFNTESLATAIGKSVAAFSTSILMIQSWGYWRFAIAWNGPGWTLSVECAFYLLFPLIAHSMQKFSPRGLLALAGLSWCVSLAFNYFASTQSWLGGYHPVLHLPTFICGVALGYHYLRSQPASRAAAHAMTLAGLASFLSIAAIASSLPHILVNNSIFIPSFGLFIYGLAQGGWPARFLSSPTLRLLGDSSYSFYILQFGVIAIFALLVSSWPISPEFFYLLSLVTLTLVSIMVFRLIETPLRGRIRNRLNLLVQARRGWAEKPPNI